MPTTFADITPVRRVAVGDCSGPLGSGFDALARSAYASLLRSGWTESADPPFLPVHDNGQTANKTIPRGDAWKCSYGYDAAARTERSACGAVCYTFALPGDAYSGTPANISTVALSLTGDRYLDAGVDLYLVPSASPTPPTIPEILALTPVGTYCATSDQSPTPPNERHGVTAAVEATPGVAAQPYLHVALVLHDYTTNRGAWVEGGAMLEGAAATITFSREVAEDAPPNVRLLIVSSKSGNDPSLLWGNIRHAFSEIYIDYRVASGETTIFSDFGELIRLAYSGALPDVRSQRAFWTANYASASSAATSSGAYSLARINSISFAFFVSPGLVPGMEISSVEVVNTGVNPVDYTIALVQHDEIAPDGTDLSDVPITKLPRIDQVFAGNGSDIVAISQETIAGSATETPTMRVVSTPTKPYVSLVLLMKSTGGVVIKDGKCPFVLVASMPTA